ncbi:Arginine--tRNA ligase [Nymphon striatum]|nr:Arginine--tRNA ligase [Nymphon striatum]
MGKDGTPFKTRTGGTVKLIDLLKEAQQRALDLVTEKNPDLDQNSREAIANTVGIGAVKYADLKAIEAVAKDGTPNLLCNYLYELSGNFMTFYEACPIMKADDNIKQSRLRLSQLTANTLKVGLDLLGIDVMERM